MRALVQRVAQATVYVDGTVVGAIQQGLLALVGIKDDDTLQDVAYLVDKVRTLRVFTDADGKMNLDVQDVRGAILVVSQFTLYADTHRGRRPSFTRAARPPLAQELYTAFLATLARHGIPVAQGRFGAHMAVSLVNDGPVTLLLESPGTAGKQDGAIQGGWTGNPTRDKGETDGGAESSADVL